MTRHPAFLALAASTFSLLTACGPGGDDATPSAPVVTDVPVQVETVGEPDPIAVPTAQRGGTFATWGGPYPKSLNAWLDNNSFSGGICGLMFESLVTLHSTKDEPVGALAESWETSADGKTFTFHLDPRAKWSDGQPVTAEDVQFYYDVIMNPKNLTSLYRVDLSRFSRPEVVDAHTLRITATEPHWANFWAAAGLVAFPKHVWKDVDFNKQNFEFPVVSGPYALEEVKTNRSVSLKRRGDWWGRVKQYNVGKYNFDHLLFISMEDRNKMLEVFKKGEIDAYPIYTAQIWAEKTNFTQVQKNWVVRQEVENREPKGVQGLVINLRREKFQDPRVRQALAYVFNRKLMNEKLMFNQYFILDSYYPDLYPNNTNPDLAATPYDPAKARQLLKDAGWEVGSDGVLAKDGQPFDLNILHSGEDLRHLNIYDQDLKAIGIRPKIDLVSRASYTKRTDTQDFDVFWLATGAGRLRDPEASWSSKQANEIATNNYSGVADPKIDELIERQKTEPDLAVRNDILRQIDARLMEISPFVLMWQSRGARLLYWNRYGTPKYVLDKFSREDAAMTYWWLDKKKEAALDEAMKTNTDLPPEPAQVTYED